MHTGQLNPQPIFNEHISGKIVLNNSNNQLMFPALNVSINSATIDYDAHIITKIDYTMNHVFILSQYKNYTLFKQVVN